MLKVFMVVPFVALMLFASSSCGKTNNSELIPSEAIPQPPIIAEEHDTVFMVVEEMPEFQGGNAALLSFLAKNAKYPVTAKEKGIQGKVIARFCVNTDGSISRVTIIKGASPELDLEAIRVLKTLPSFKPGKQGGIPVPVWYAVPISFTLQ